MSGAFTDMDHEVVCVFEMCGFHITKSLKLTFIEGNLSQHQTLQLLSSCPSGSGLGFISRLFEEL